MKKLKPTYTLIINFPLEKKTTHPIHSTPSFYQSMLISSKTMPREILNSEGTPVSTQELFSLMTEMKKTQSGYMSNNSFKNKKTKLLSSFMSNKSPFNSPSNFLSLKSTNVSFSSVSLFEAEFKNLLNSLHKYFSSFFSCYLPQLQYIFRLTILYF
jgi:hypothetical protein